MVVNRWSGWAAAAGMLASVLTIGAIAYGTKPQALTDRKEPPIPISTVGRTARQ